MKNKVATILILIVTLVLAGVAIFTAIRLYQLRQEAVAPTAPTQPKAATETSLPSIASTACTITFTLAATAPPTSPPPTSPPPTSPPPTSPPPTSPSGPPNTCGGTCGSNSNCQSDLICSGGFCRNPQCITAENCVCGTGTPLPSLPPSGVSWPTLLGVAGGAVVVIASLAALLF